MLPTAGITLEESDQLQRQLAYQRTKEDQHQRERLDWALKLAEKGDELKTIHGQEWQLRQLKVNLAELQKVISDGHLALFEQRELRMRLQQENDKLKLIDHENRQKLLELAALQDTSDTPSATGIFGYKDCRPEKTIANSKKFKAIKASLSYTSPSNPSVQPKVGAGTNKRGAQPLKAIFLPNEDVNRYKVQLEQLRALEEMKRTVYEQHIQALQKDMLIREEEMHLKESDFAGKIKELQDRANQAEKRQHTFNQDYFGKRYSSKKEEDKLKDDQNSLKENNQLLQNTRQNVHSKTQFDLAVQKGQIVKQSQKYEQRFRQQALQKEDQLSLLRHQYQKAQEEYIQEIRVLELREEQVKVNFHKLEDIRNGEIGQFAQQVKQLRARLKEIEGHTKRLKKMVDEDDQRLAEVLEDESTANLDFEGLENDLAKIQTSLNQARTKRYLKVLKRAENPDIN